MCVYAIEVLLKAAAILQKASFFPVRFFLS